MNKQSPRTLALAAALLVAGLFSNHAVAQTTLVPMGATWSYLDDGSDQGTAWKEPVFNDTFWSSGPAPLGYSDDTTLATTNSFGGDPNNKHITYYYRHSFNAPSPGSYTNLRVNVRFDDGVVLYLNGTEVFRGNLPEGEITAATTAPSAVAGDGNTVISALINSSLLNASDNVLAAEIHQTSATSTDIVFDMNLIGNPTPSISITSPTNGQVVASVNLNIETDAVPGGESIAQIDYYQGGNLLGSATEAPFNFVWTGIVPGNYTLSAEITDSSGLTATSDPVSITAVQPPPTLIPLGATWKYLDNGSDQGTAWRELNYDDSAWAQGPGELGYGDGDEATIVGFGPDSANKYVTTYFRHKFVVDDPSLYGSLPSQLIYDDGAIVFVNGVEVQRVNLPSGPISSTVLASSANDYAPFTFVTPIDVLVPGTNIVAVEMHQANGTSSDLSFNLEMLGDTPPSVILTSPANGANFVGPTNVTLTALASDISPGMVTLVEFFQSGIRIGADATEPYSVVWSNVTENTYSVTAVATDDRGGQGISNPVTITITDPSPPSLIEVLAITNEVSVRFSKRVEPVTGLDPGNYTLSNGASVLGASYQGNNSNVVVLSVSPLNLNTTYTLTVNDVRDLAGQPIAPNSMLTFEVSSFLTADIGNPVLAGSTSLSGGILSVTGSGTNIVGNSDQFFFAYQQVVGDFDLRVRVNSLSLADTWAKAGLMARETLAADARHATAFATPSISGSYFQFRNTVGGNSTIQGSFPVAYPNTWLRVQRQGNTFTGYAGFDGENWMQLGQTTLASASSVFFVGQAVTSANESSSATAGFANIGDAIESSVGSIPIPVEPAGPSSRNTGLVITEIMYHPADHPTYSNRLDFIEIFNSQSFSEDLSGFRISGDVDYVFPDGTSLPGGSMLVVARDVGAFQAVYGIQALGPFEDNRGIPNEGGTVRLRNELDAVLLEIDYEGEAPWPIEPDGTGHSLVLTHPSYGENSYKAWSPSAYKGGSPGSHDPVVIQAADALLINEFLAHTDDPMLDYIEIYNKSNQSLDVSGYWLSDDRNTNKFRIPNGTTIPARGFLFYDQNTLGFALNSGGERIFLVNAANTRVLDAVDFAGQANGISTGRYPDGAPGFQELVSPTPGSANNPMLTRDIVINEMMYNPISDNDDDEYLELYNKGVSPVDVSGWEFRDGIEYTIPQGTIINPDSFLVVAKNATNLIAKYAQLNANNTVGNYDGVLANGGERVRLSMPDEVIEFITNGTMVVTETNTIFIVVDEVTYADGGRWGEWTDGRGSSMELRDAAADNRLAPNWGDSDETAKAPWTSLEKTAPFDNGQGANNELQIMILGRGECLIDDVHVSAGSGANAVLNPGFDNGLTSWLLQGNHVNSFLDNSEGNSSPPSLHIVASAGGDNGANRIEVDLATSLPTSGNGTVRAKVRWLRGFPIILLKTHGNWIELAARMTVPDNLGSPGLPNSIAVPNLGPAITEVTHNPILPAGGESVVVSARIDDPDGVSQVRLRYRIDPSGNLSTVNMTDNGTGGDLMANDGVYSATIPAQATGTLVGFRVEAVDGASASTTFPQNVPTEECYVRFGDDIIPGNFGVYRMWMNAANISEWDTRPTLSNEALDGTFVYGNFRAIYNAGARYRGSPFLRDSYDTPTGNRCAYVWTLPEDDLFLGTDELNMDSLEPGDRDATTLREITAFWIGRKMGLPFSHQRNIHVVVNGVSNAERNVPSYSDTQQPDGSYMTSWYPEDDGEIYKIDDWFEFADDVIHPQQEFNQNAQLQVWNTTDLSTGQTIKKKARYRWSWEKKFLRGRLDDDYSSLFEHVDVLDAPSASALNVSQIESIIDSENWLTVFAHRRLISDWDGYGYDRGKNQFLYVQQNGLSQMIPWDLDFALGCNGGHAPTQNVLAGSNDPVITRLRSNPHFLRIFHRALQRAVDGPLQDDAVLEFLQERFEALQQNGITSLGVFRSPFVASGAQNISIPEWIRQRRNNLLTVIPQAEFAVDLPSTVNIEGNLLQLNGTAPVLVKFIRVNGQIIPVNWTSVLGWTGLFVVEPGNSTVTITGLDIHGQPVTGDLNIAVNSSGEPATAQESIVFNEIMYNPTTPGAGFVEIYNQAANTSFDISGWEINGLGFTFPEGSIITNGGYLVVVENPGVFASAYSTPANIAGTYDGVLDLDGETLTLIRPGQDSQPGTEIDKVRYEIVAPWVQTPNGTGRSLQLIDAARDNSRVSNWSDGAGWRYYEFTGPLGTIITFFGTNTTFFMPEPGEVIIDDVELVQGTTAGAGVNLLENPGFESGSLAPWEVLGSHSTSFVTTEAAHSGTHALHIIATGAGSTFANVRQSMAADGMQSANTYTLSFYFLPVQESLLNFNITSTFRSGSPTVPVIDVSPILNTPGVANTSAAFLPAYDSVWLNEVQPNNVTGPTDNAGQRDAWVELYNSGATTVDLSGYYLANNYDSDLTQWAFPAGASLAPGQFKLVWLDGQTGQSTASEWHASITIPGTTGSLALVRQVGANPQITDYLNYTALPADQSYGDFPDGQPFNREVLVQSTPGNPNIAKAFSVFINEWMAQNTAGIMDPADGDFEDWFELYNPGTEPVDLGGYFLTDDLGDKNQFLIPAGYVIPAGGFLLVFADDDEEQNLSGLNELHVNFQLSAAGEEIGLFSPTGIEIDSVIFGAQTMNVSEGRFPDGSEVIRALSVATPGAPNQDGGNNMDATIMIAEGVVSASFPAIPGKTYRILYADNLNPPVVWMQLVPDIVATGNSIEITDTIDAGGSRYYQIQQLD